MNKQINTMNIQINKYVIIKQIKQANNKRIRQIKNKVNQQTNKRTIK